MTSSPEAIPHIIRWMWGIKPKSILDIGFGNGKYGFLAREYLQITVESMTGELSHLEIDGIDAYSGAISEINKNIYDSVKIGKIEDIEIKKTYDLILWIDVLEHIDKNTALYTLKRNLDNGRQHIISTPLEFFKEDIKINMEYDNHKSLITLEDIQEVIGKRKWEKIPCDGQLLMRVINDYSLDS